MSIKKAVMMLAGASLLMSCGKATERPATYKLDFWICESIDIEALKASNIIEKQEEKIRYLDSKYTLEKNQDNEPVLPNTRANYILTNVNNNWMVTSIYITDPNIKIYGLSMKSSDQKIDSTLKARGYKFLNYHGLYPAYSKDDVEIRIYPSFISVWASIINAHVVD